MTEAEKAFQAQSAVVSAPSLVQKLANVLGNSERVAKNGFNKFHNYAYATEADISASVRTEMAKQGLMMIPTVENIEWQVVETNGGKKEKLCTVSWLFTMLDADSDAKIEFRNVGQGQDSGDKAFYKAATGALKYALKMLFLIPTGDDPEEASPEHGTVVDHKAVDAAAKVQADRLVAWSKIVGKFAEVGKSEAEVWAHIGRPANGAPTNTEWEKALAWGKELRAAKPVETPSREPTDAEIAAEREARAKAEKPNPAQVAKAFGDFVQQIRDATTPEGVTFIQAAAVAAGLPKGEIAALTRQAKDRVLVLKDATPKKLTIEDVPF